MRRHLNIAGLIGIMLIGLQSNAQNVANIANTRVQLKGDKVQITFDIINKSQDAWFLVGVEITNSGGSALNAVSFTGDFGEAQKSGKNKVIIWDPVADSIFLNETINIQVYVNMILPTPPTVAEEIEKASKELDPAINKSRSNKEFNRTGIVLQSVALPGLGLTRVTGKPHWIKGLAGYGCIAGAVVFNKKAVDSYKKYSAAESSDAANSLYSTTIKQSNISQGLAFTAIAIWVVDITWTIIGTKDLNKGQSMSQHKGLSIDTDYDLISNTPLLSFKYTF